MLTRRKATEPSRAATTLGTKNRRGVAETTWRCKRRPGGRRMFWAQVLAQAAGGRRLRGGAGLGSSLPLSLFWRLTGRGAGQICKGEGRQTRVCVCARACDAGPRGRGRSGHREPQGLYDGGAVVRIPGVGAGCGLAGCQVPGGGEAAEGRGQRAEGEQRQAERVQPRCPAGPGVASVGLACRNRRSRQVARRDDRWLPFPRRLDKDKDGQESNPCPPPVLSAYGIWLEPPLFLSDGPDCLAPHSPVLRGERGGRSSNIGRAEAPTR